MKTFVSLLILLAALTACQPTDDEKAAPLLAKIERLNGQGRYQTALDSIRLLRKNFPQALETRKKALILWQEASLKMAQADIAKTDSALQQVLRSLETGKYGLRTANRMRAQRDSLHIRYDALCAMVRAIHRRQK